MIGTQINTYVEGRLQRWSVWYHATPRPGPRKVISWWGPMVLDRKVQTLGLVTPSYGDPGECIETDFAVYRLPPDMRDAVTEHWTTGGTVEDKIRRLHCCKQTFYNRLTRANQELLGLFNDIAAGILAVRAPTIKKNLTELDCFRTFTATVA